jgi:hypothetical protein
MRRRARLAGLITALFLTGCATDPWSNQDKVLQAGVALSFLVDAGQTLDIKNHASLQEGNKILGTHPSDGRVKGYFAAAFVIHTLVIHFAPASWRPYLQGGTILFQTGVVIRNDQVGLQINF